MKREVRKQLRALGVDPDGLCSFLARETNYGQNCDHTFKHTRILLLEYWRMTPEQTDKVIAYLESQGAVCDCETGFNVCGV